MDRALNKEILRLSIPSILANVTILLVGMVDTAVAGHLVAAGGAGAASCIGGISVGTMLFNLLYWNFSFLRTGTGGLTAQAFGREDMRECASIFARGAGLALFSALLLLSIQWPFAKLSLLVVEGTPEVEALASRYFFIRIWAAPATLLLMAFRGWFVGMQDSVSSMWTDLIVNAVNVAASIILTFGIGSWSGLGFDGIPLGTVVAQYSGLLFAILVAAVKYGKKVFASLRKSDIKASFSRATLGPFMKMNFDLFLRSVGFIGIYIGYTAIAATFGDVFLACSSIMMQLLMLFSYFTDGFAYAGEALTGRFIGAKDLFYLRRTTKYIFVWSMAIAVLFIGVYILAGNPFLRLLTNDPDVIDACRAFLPWLALMPPFGCAAFTWDGIFLGATSARPMRNAMLFSMAAFFAVWFLGTLLVPGLGLGTSEVSPRALHLLLAAYFAHLLVRTVYLSFRYKPVVVRPLIF